MRLRLEATLLSAVALSCGGQSVPAQCPSRRRLLQDFKEAARLSTEAKALAADAASAAEKAAGMAEELAGLGQRESLQREEVALLEEALQDARRAAALAQWRRPGVAAAVA